MKSSDVDVFEKLKVILLEFLALNNKQSVVESSAIRMETRIVDDLGIDSIELMDLVSLLEARFDLKIEPTELLDKRTISDVVALILMKQVDCN